MITINTKSCAGGLVLVVGMLSAAASHAFNFVPTDAEFSSWPAYCQAVYVDRTNIGRQSKFGSLVGQTQRRDLAVREQDGIYAPHHSCAGMIWLHRAKRERNEKSRNFKLRRALSETMFTYIRSNNRSFYFADVAAQLAMIRFEQGEIDQAMLTLEGVVRQQPENPIPYSAMAVIQMKLDNHREARRILVEGDEAIQGKSAEIKYNLGLVAFELGELDEAVDYAAAAYGLGYPLMGLRRKLERAGMTIPRP